MDDGRNLKIFLGGNECFVKQKLVFSRLNISVGVRFVLDIIGHTMGKCSWTNLQITPLTHLYMDII
jgi:hypothetical protein